MRAFAVVFAALALAAGAGSAPTVTVERDVVYARPGGVPVALDAYRPTGGGAKRPAVVVIHGGGFTGGDKRAMARFAERLAALGFVAFSINYRLAPQYLFPAAHDDAKAVVRFIRANAKRFGVDPARIGALGSSAGGNLAGIVGTAGSGRRDRGARVAAVVSWSGIMDLRQPPTRRNGPDALSPFIGCALSACPQRYALASPITHVDRTDARFLLAHSEAEFVPLTQATTMADKLRAARVPVTLRMLPGFRHATAFAADVWDETVAFFRRHLALRRA